MERKIGEIFEYNGEWYQCIESDSCRCGDCDFSELGDCDNIACTSGERSDDKEVYFKKLEKIGKPYMLEDKKFQKYRVFYTPYIYNKIDYSWQSFADPYYISLEIKEDMKEKKLNLKPFDIQKAREGKPVCTRDGRKARIICFDKKCLDEQILIVLVDCGKEESIYFYTTDGKCIDDFSSFDLMMFPEKKEGWIVIHKEAIYDKETAEKIARETTADVIRIQKIEWEG